MRKIYLVEVFGVDSRICYDFDFENEMNNPNWRTFKTLKEARVYAVALRKKMLEEHKEKLQQFKHCNFSVDIYKVESEEELNTTYLLDVEQGGEMTLWERKYILGARYEKDYI